MLIYTVLNIIIKLYFKELIKVKGTYFKELNITKELYSKELKIVLNIELLKTIIIL